MKNLVLTIIVFFSFNEIKSQVPTIQDLSFGDSGKVELSIDDYDYLTKIVAWDSSLYFVGYTGKYTTSLNYDAVIGKLDYWGNLDTTFNEVGYARFDFPGDNHSIINDVAINDSGIFFIGTSLIYGVADTLHLFLGKYNFNGTLDTNFASGGFYTPDIGSRYISGKGVLLTPDNKIVFCGASENIVTLSDYPLMGRLQIDGSLDTTFGNTGIRIWDTNGSLIDGIAQTDMVEKHGAGAYLTEVTMVNNSYLFSGYYMPGFNSMAMMIKVDPQGNLDMNFGGLGYRIFEIAPNFNNNIVSTHYRNELIYSLIDVGGSNTGNVTLYIQDTVGIEQSRPSFAISNFLIESNEMVITPSGQIGISGYITTAVTHTNTKSDHYFTIETDSIGVLNSSYSDIGMFIEDFNSSESGVDDLFYADSNLYAGGYVTRLDTAGAKTFNYTFVRLVYDMTTSLTEIQDIELSLYPNPSSSVIYLKTDQNVNAIVSITDLLGKIVYSGDLNNSYQINIAQYPKGLYILSIIDPSTGHKNVRKFTVH